MNENAYVFKNNGSINLPHVSQTYLYVYVSAFQHCIISSFYQQIVSRLADMNLVSCTKDKSNIYIVGVFVVKDFVVFFIIGNILTQTR